MKKKLIIPSIILLVLIVTLVSSVAFFSYVKEGNKESSIQIGDLTFKYTETSGKGQGINLDDAFPLSDTEGKALTEYFDFKVEANLTRSDLAYTVELDTSVSDLPAEGIKVYLTEIKDGNEVEINSIVNTISNYQTSDNGRIIYSETIPRNTKNYVKNFRLRLWIDESIDWTDDLYMGHSGTFKVNVKANSNSSMAATDVVTDKTTSIERVVANDKYLFTASSDTGVDYEVTVPYTVDNVDIEVYESNTQATSVVTPINSLSGVSSKVTNQNIHTGNNYFKITTTSSNGTTTGEHIVKVVKEADNRNALLNLEVEGYSLTPTFDPEVTEYTLTLEEPTINIVGNAESDIATITGLGEKTLVFGSNEYTVTVTPEDTNTSAKTYTITVTNSRPIAPTITGGTGTNWVSTNQTISLANPNAAFAISGIVGYEYYKTTSTTAPTDSTTGTSLTSPYSLPISDEGTTYIYYRTVSNKGYKSVWSSAQVVNKDSTAPTLAVSKFGKKATINMSDNYGVVAYGVTTSSGEPTWTSITSTTSNQIVYSAPSTGTYNVWIKNKSGLTAHSAVSLEVCSVAANTVVANYSHKTSAYTYTTPCEGYYKIELWGAQGGSNVENYAGAKGSYTSGQIALSKSTKLYAYVGSTTGWNGGGTRGTTGYANNIGGNGGGATDIRISSSLASRIMVAGGGGGAGGNTGEGQYHYFPSNSGFGHAGSNDRTLQSSGGAGGGSYAGTGGGANGDITSLTTASYGSNPQSSLIGGNGTNGSFGQGGNGGTPAMYLHGLTSYQNVYSGGTGAGGGGGYFGGGGGAGACGWWANTGGSGGGGSSYISGHKGSIAIKSASNTTEKSGCSAGTTNIECSYFYDSKYIFTNTKIIAGNGYNWSGKQGSLEQMPNPSGGYYASGTGHTGNGYARITYLGD